MPLSEQTINKLEFKEFLNQLKVPIEVKITLTVNKIKELKIKKALLLSELDDEIDILKFSNLGKIVYMIDYLTKTEAEMHKNIFSS